MNLIFLWIIVPSSMSRCKIDCRLEIRVKDQLFIKTVPGINRYPLLVEIGQTDDSIVDLSLVDCIDSQNLATFIEYKPEDRSNMSVALSNPFSLRLSRYATVATRITYLLESQQYESGKVYDKLCIERVVGFLALWLFWHQIYLTIKITFKCICRVLWRLLEMFRSVETVSRK